MRQPEGWFKCPASVWASVAATLPKPWTREQMAADLQWYENEIRAGRMTKIPGRRRLRARWGVGDWEARSVLRGHSSRLPPTSLPVASRLPPGLERSNLDNAANSSRLSPASLPLPSRSPPHARSSKKEEKEKEEQWRAVCSLWDEFKGRSDGTTAQRLKRSRGQGAQLWAMRDRLDDLRRVFEWIKGSQSYQAKHLGGGYDTKPITIKRGLDRYVDDAAEWAASEGGTHREWALALAISGLPGGEKSSRIEAGGYSGHAARCIRSAANNLQGLTERQRSGADGQRIRERLAQRLESGEF